MKPVFTLLFATIACASCFKSRPAAPITGNCKQNSPLYLSITCNGNTRTSVSSHTDLVKLTFMGTGFQILNEIYDKENSAPAITIMGFVPASNAAIGIYGDSTYHTSLRLYLGSDQYYSTYFRLHVSSLGSAKPGSGYDAIEYNDASGSYTGTFKSTSGKADVEVTGEFCMDMPEETYKEE